MAGVWHPGLALLELDKKKPAVFSRVRMVLESTEKVWSAWLLGLYGVVFGCWKEIGVGRSSPKAVFLRKRNRLLYLLKVE